jgi:hypothetical protein
VTAAGRDGPGRVVGTDSRMLFDALASVFTALGFDGLDDEVLRDLVVARVVEPTSLLDAGRVLRDLGQSAASYATMKRTLGRAATGKYRDRIATWCFQHASTDGDISLVLYDVTTLYFEAEKEDELRKVGYSKFTGQCMSQPVRSDVGQSSAFAGPLDHITNEISTYRPTGRPACEEHVHGIGWIPRPEDR